MKKTPQKCPKTGQNKPKFRLFVVSRLKFWVIYRNKLGEIFYKHTKTT